MDEANVIAQVGAENTAGAPPAPAAVCIPLTRAKQVMVLRRDGVWLATDRYRSGRGGRFSIRTGSRARPVAGRRSPVAGRRSPVAGREQHLDMGGMPGLE